MRQKQLLRSIYWVSGFLILFIFAFLISIFFLNPSSVGNQNFLSNFNLWAFVWALIFILILILTFVLARNIIHLFFEYHSGQPGSRIKGKLVLTFIVFSIFPSMIMFFLAFGLINQNLSKWATAPSEQLIGSSQIIAQKYYDTKRLLLVSAAERLAERYDSAGRQGLEELLPLAARDGFDAIFIADRAGKIIHSVGAESGHNLTPGQLAEARPGYPAFLIDKAFNVDPGMIDQGWVIVELPSPEEAPGRTLAFGFRLPESIEFHLLEVREAHRVHQELRGTLDSLRTNYFLVLTATMLCVVFGFVWLGSYIARKLTVPLEALAEGSRELAGGNFDHRVEVAAVDELGILVDSFNLMATQLKENREQLERANFDLTETNVELDERRRYIETILQNIATAVLTIDHEEVIRTANQAALKLLQAMPKQIISRPIREVADNNLYREFLDMKKGAELFGIIRRQLTIHRNGRVLYVAATVTTTRAPQKDSSEFLIVLDDLTELIRAEKFAAWQEVARRLAHEIKNPLTPIQLSAERVGRRFQRVAESLPSHPAITEYGEVLGEATRMIIEESRRLKSLITEFSRFARLPVSKPVQTSLHDLILKSLSPYGANFSGIQVETEFDPKVDLVEVDPEQMQRVFINLLENSLDALSEITTEKSIRIKTQANPLRGAVIIEFSDSGPGIPPADQENLFLPYFSTKKKGTGLGLAIVRQIVTEHKGFIRIEPNHPSGTRVIIEIPGLHSEDAS